jgi:hypothetical protein
MIIVIKTVVIFVVDVRINLIVMNNKQKKVELYINVLFAIVSIQYLIFSFIKIIA